MPGRRRTGSSPSRTWMSLAVYVSRVAISVGQLRLSLRQLDFGRDDPHDALFLADRVALAAARGHRVPSRPHFDASAFLRLHHDPFAGAEAEHAIAVGRFD